MGAPLPAPQPLRRWRLALADWESTGFVWSHAFSPLPLMKVPHSFPNAHIFPDLVHYAHPHYAQLVAVPARPPSYVFAMPAAASAAALVTATAGAAAEVAAGTLAAGVALAAAAAASTPPLDPMSPTFHLFARLVIVPLVSAAPVLVAAPLGMAAPLAAEHSLL